MKLVLSRVLQGCRLGVLSDLGKAGEFSLDVPGCLLSSQCATVPHLTPDTLHTIKDLPSVMQVTLDSFAEHHEVLQEFGGGVRKFAGLHNTALFSTLHYSNKPCPPGHATKKTVSVWGRGGRIELTAARFIDVQAAIQPDCYQSMADGETWQADSSRSRARKAVDRTLAHLDECLRLHQDTQELQHCKVFGILVGGDVMEERLRSARETAKRPVDGFSLDGFQTSAMQPDVKDQILQATLAELPEEKPRLVLGVGSPDEVISCVEAGVDLFESFFPFQVTERGCALSFDFSIDRDCETAGSSSPAVLEANGATAEVQTSNREESMTAFEINLKEKRFVEDFHPLVKGCECYCCKKHTRAYLHHLLVTGEMLAGVLLMLHNMTRYLAFFKALRQAIACDRLEDFKRQVLRHNE